MPKTRSRTASVPPAKKPPLNFAALLARWPDTNGSSLRTVAHDLDISYFTVHAWGRRNSIPHIWWEALVESAVRHRVSGITYPLLQKLDAAARRPSSHPILQRPQRGVGLRVRT